MKDINGAVVRGVNIRTAIKFLTEQRSELNQYSGIVENVNATDVSTDTEFQRMFNRFYKVRRNAEWRTDFYSVFEACKTVESLTFEHILRTLYLKTGRIEASFSSKLLSALNPDMPIWDSIVLSKLNLKPSTSENRDRRLDNAVKIYQDIVRWYQEFLQTPEARDFITAFDAAFPEFVSITAVKKVDFLLWGSGMKAGSHVEENKYLLYSHFGIKENDNGPEDYI